MAKSGAPYSTISTSKNLSCAVTVQGDIVAWGGSGQYGTDPAPSFPPGPYITTSTGTGYGLAVTASGNVVSAGTPAPYNMGQAAVPAGLGPALMVSAGRNHALALLADGTVAGWGSNSDGETIPPAALTDVIKVVAASSESMALKSDGTIVSWGYIDNDVASSLADIVDLAAFDSTFIALKSDGTVVTWEKYGSGPSESPAGLSGVTQVACGSGHFSALLDDGTVVCWGDNASGQADPPIDLAEVSHIQAGADQTIAVKSDGTVVMWGKDNVGQSTPPPGLAALIPGELDPAVGALSASVQVRMASTATNSPVGTISSNIHIRFRGSAYQDWMSQMPPIQLQQVYLCTLTGAEDGLDDLSLQVSSWQATSQAGGRSSYLQVIVPASQGLLEAISDRSNGQIIIRKGYILPGGSTQSSEILRCSFETFRHDRGPRRFTLTMSGYRSGIVEKSGTRTLTGVRSISTTNGKRRVRADIDLFLQPGMTVQADNETFQAGHINYYATDRDEFCEVGEA